MTAKRFKVGDQAELLSGGPIMTVTSLDEPTFGGDEYVQTKWFSGKKLEAGRFPVGALKLSPPKNTDDKAK